MSQTNSDFGAPGADSSAEVGSIIEGKTLIQLAEGLFGTTPVLWGRYFKDTQHVGGVHYNPATENALLAANNIRLLPIAQQTNDVAQQDQALGVADAEKNVDALFQAFSPQYLAARGGQFYFYLDVEGPPSLSADFYLGWANTIESYSMSQSNGTVHLLPSLYCNMDPTTWSELQAAMTQGASCHSAWLARWYVDAVVCAPLRAWNDAKEAPVPAPPCPVHLWQYARDCKGGDGFDMDMTNPSIVLTDYLRFLIPTA